MDKDYYWVDNLRTIATISVILLHVSAAPVPLYGAVDAYSWWVGNIFDGSLRFCVPIFFMISGALLLSKDYSLSSFFKKRFFRIIPPLIFWSLVYLAFNLVCKYYFKGETQSASEVVTFIFSHLYNGSSGHLWFVYTIIGLYLIVPIARKFIKYASHKEIIYFLLIWGITLLFNWPYLKDYKPAIEIMYFSGYLGYMILGYFLAQNSNKILNNRWLAVSMVLVGNLITVIATYLLSNKANAFDTTMYRYLTPNVALSAIGIFLIFKNIRIKSALYGRFVGLISRNSYGIYLIHILILTILTRIGIDWQFTTPAVSFIVISTICFVISSITIVILRKIKFLNKWVG